MNSKLPNIIIRVEYRISEVIRSLMKLFMFIFNYLLNLSFVAATIHIFARIKPSFM